MKNIYWYLLAGAIKKCKAWQKSGKDVYFYFDNDQLGYAAFNAEDIKAMMEA